MLVRDMDLAPGANHMADGRRLEVVVDGVSLFHGAQLAIETTLVSSVRVDGARRGHVSGARPTRPHTHPTLTHHPHTNYSCIICKILIIIISLFVARKTLNFQILIRS